MADISQYLQDILDAVFGEQVRGSIHDAIEIINDVSEVILTTGTAVTGPTSSSTGFFTDSLYLNTNTYELWKCVGTDSWTSEGVIKGAAGAPGADGNKWYRGTGISGKAANPTVYSGSGITLANPNDFYLNPVEGAVYHCVAGGDASAATWSYDFTMTGGGGGDVVTWTQIQTSTGATKIAEIDINGSSTDVYAPSGGGGGLSNAFDEVVVGATTIAASGGDTLTLSAGSNVTLTPNASDKSVTIAASGGGHTMIDNTDLINEMNTAIQDITDDEVVSAYGVGKWSNVDAFQILTAVSADDDGVGTWEDDDTWETSGVRTGWITHSALYGVLSNDDVEIEPVFKITSGASDAVSLYAMRIDDAVTGSTGGVALKFNAPITASGYVGIRLKHLRTNTEIV